MEYIVKLYDKTGNIFLNEVWKASSLQSVVYYLKKKMDKLERDLHLNYLDFEIITAN